MAKVNQIVSQATPTYQAENLNQFARDINNIVHKGSVYHGDYNTTEAPKGLSKEERAELDELNRQDKEDKEKLKGMK